MRKPHETLSAIVFSVLLAVTTTGHATVIASYTPPTVNSTFGLVGPSFIGAQTFIANTTAKVGLVSLVLQRQGPQPLSAIVIDLRDTISGEPTSSVLGTIEFVLPELPFTPTFFDADFSALAITLEEGAIYAVSLELPGSGGVSWRGNSFSSETGNPQPNPFPDGQFFDSFDDGLSWREFIGEDFSFVINAVPEPATAALITLGLAGLGFARRRRLNWGTQT